MGYDVVKQCVGVKACFNANKCLYAMAYVSVS